MIDLAADLIVIAFKLATAAALAFACVFAIAVLFNERDRVRLRRSARRAARAYGLSLVPRPGDKLADRRDRRQSGGAA